MTSGRMAAVSAPHELDIREADVPKPAPEQVVVEIRYCGVCGTDVHDFLGAMAMLASGAVDVGPVITGTVGLSELASVLSDLGSGATHHAKVLVDPTR